MNQPHSPTDSIDVPRRVQLLQQHHMALSVFVAVVLFGAYFVTVYFLYSGSAS